MRKTTTLLCAALCYFTLVNADALPDYQFMSHAGSNLVTCTGDKPFETETYYPTGTTEQSEEIMVYMNTIASGLTTAYYYNINRGNNCSGTNLFSTNQSIGFTNGKTTWQRLIVKDDESKDVINAAKDYFRVIKADNSEILMTQTQADGSPGEDDSFTVSADVTFSGGKANSFSVYYGSVNSGSKMDELFEPITIGDYCIKAKIIYCFKTNMVTIEQLQSATDFCFMDAETSSGVTCDINNASEDITFFPKNTDTPESNKAFVKEIPANIKTACYWNLNVGAQCNGNNFFPANENVTFSSGKEYASWLRVIVHDDLTSENVAASSYYFKVAKVGTSDVSDVRMTQTLSDGMPGSDDTYTVAADVDFDDGNKSFEIYYGSVNSGSKMSSLTNVFSVSEDCTKAQIIYCFKTNQVSIVEKEWYIPTGIHVNELSSKPIKQIFVYDVYGRLIYADTQVNKPSYTINDLDATGIYIVKIVIDQGVKTIKIYK